MDETQLRDFVARGQAAQEEADEVLDNGGLDVRPIRSRWAKGYPGRSHRERLKQAMADVEQLLVELAGTRALARSRRAARNG